MARALVTGSNRGIGLELARHLGERGLEVIAACRTPSPQLEALGVGFVRTDMTGGSGNLTPEQSARGLLDRLDELGPDSSGTFWHGQGEVLPW